MLIELFYAVDLIENKVWHLISPHDASYSLNTQFSEDCIPQGDGEGSEVAAFIIVQS